MHELSLAEGVVSALADFAHQKGRRVTRFKVTVGELSQFDQRVIQELLEDLVKGTGLEQSGIEVELEAAKVACLNCGSKWGFHQLVEPLAKDDKEMIHFLPELLNSFSKCPSCSKSYFEIEEGRSVRVSEVEFDVR